MQINVAAVAAGQAPTEIFTKTFLDNFVFIGGCGTLICLLIALMLSAVSALTGRWRKRRSFRCCSILMS